jgi:hypothetical protein
MDKTIPWWEHDAETLEKVARLPDWDGFHAYDLPDPWPSRLAYIKERKDSVIRDRNGIVAQIVRYTEYV